MKHTILLVILFALTFGLTAQETITLAADPWPPFNMDPAISSNEGFMIDIARAVFEPLGYKVEYSVLPWTKALKETENGKFTAVVGAAHEDAEGFIFPQKAQGVSELAFFVRQDDGWKYSGISSLKGKKLGVILDYSYGSDIDEFLKDNPDAKWAFGDLPLIKNFTALSKGDIDVVLATKAVGEYTVNEIKLNDNIRIAGTDESLDAVYVAFSPKNPKSKEYAKMLDEGMEKIRKNGTLTKIMSKYGMQDWE